MRCVALLRGINVGRSTMIKMEELRRTFEALSFENVKSYINSGNLAFDAGSVSSPQVDRGSRGAETTLTDTIEKAIENDLGRQIPVMVRRQQQIQNILANNPFDGEFESYKEMHVLFLKEEMPADKRTQLLEAAPEGERFAVIGCEIYCHLPKGVANSLLGKSYIEKKLKLAVTGRNWRTVQKLAEL